MARCLSLFSVATTKYLRLDNVLRTEFIWLVALEAWTFGSTALASSQLLLRASLGWDGIPSWQEASPGETKRACQRGLTFTTKPLPPQPSGESPIGEGSSLLTQ